MIKINNYIFGVAVKAVVYKKGKYLILYKSEVEDINPGSFDIPGGRLEFGEKPEEAVVREVEEETGLKVALQRLINIWTFTKENFQLVGIDFFCHFINGKESLSTEHKYFIWQNPREIKQNSNYPEWIKQTICKAEKFRKNYKLSSD